MNYVNNFNEIEDLVDKFLTKINFIDEETFFVLKGKFYLLLKNQNGSRILQKCLTNTNQIILSNLLVEVIKTL